uniref:CUB and sushi domain-containing protein 1-like n=1 Tax=Cynoglossus semilaevis TaxID=244447 RepID=A0A3P8WB35_CYNSE
PAINLGGRCEAESCGGVVQGLNGTIESPGFPHGYPNYANCTWLIITGERNRIQLTFVTLALEEDFDIVSVYDGQPLPGNLKMRLSGFMLPSPIVSSGSILALWFTTDFAVSAQGFKAVYEGKTTCWCLYSDGSMMMFGWTTEGGVTANESCEVLCHVCPV